MKKYKSHRVKLTQEEITELSLIETEKDLLKIYPNAKLIQGKVARCYYQLMDNLFISCDYFLKTGHRILDGYEFKIEDVDYDDFEIVIIYTGNEKSRNYKNLYVRKK